MPEIMPTPETLPKRPRRGVRRTIAFSVIVAFLCSLSLTLSLSAVAQDTAPKKKRKEKTYTMQPTTLKKLQKFYEYAEEEDFDSALEVLISLAKRKSLKKHDRAMVYQLMGFMYAQKEDYGRAVKAMERSIKQDAMTFASTQQVKFALGQLYMAEDRMDDAIRVLEDWYHQEENPTADANYRLAGAYMATEQFDKALPYSRKAVALSSEPKERFYQVNLGCEFQLGNFLESLDLLKLLAMHFPKPRYYKQLAFGYTELGEMDTALAVLQLSYSEGWLTEERELMSLAQRFYSQDLPFQAAKVLKKGIDDGVIEKTEAHLEFLSSALYAAREYNESLEPLSKAAELSESGDLYLRLAQVHLQVESWRDAQNALEQALAKGDLDSPHRAQLLLGITQFEQKRYQTARTAFQKASKDENLSASALQWIEHTDRQIQIQKMEREQAEAADAAAQQATVSGQEAEPTI